MHLTVSCRANVVSVPCRAMYVLTERGPMGHEHMPSPPKKKRLAESTTTPDTFDFLSDAPKNSTSIVPYCPPPPHYHLFRGTNDERRGNERESGRGRRIMPKTVPSPCQRQASASVYVYPSIPPKDSRAPPPSPRRRHLVSLVVGTPRYAQ
jgi:hypothetical protein